MSQKWQSELEFKFRGVYCEPNEPLKGRAVCVLGGGPSLTREVADALSPYPCIYANNAYMLAKEPSAVVALDRRWFGWHGAVVQSMGHMVFSALREGATVPYRGTLYRMHKDRDAIYPETRTGLPGTNSGHAAVCLAYILGASTVYVAGLDMGFDGKRTHWHEPHKVPPSEANYTLRFRPALEMLAQMALERGKVLASVTNTMADIPRVPLAQALGDLQDDANRLDNAEAPAPLPK